jgi:hypothetical protein
MNIHELDSYRLDDAVKFNDQLNPRIWGADEKMRPEVREQLLKIADDFREFLGIDVEVKDITVSGSNAAYTYTPHSDIDLHLVVDLPKADASEVYRELFDAKKYAYNDQHNIKIGGYDVELYVQDANKPHISQGIYSVKNNDWISVPKRRKPDVNDISVQSKFEDLGHRIEQAIASGDYEKMSAMTNKIKEYRQAGLDAHGEFGPENLAFKTLRAQGLIEKLYAARNAAKDQLLSLDERRKKKTKKKVKYGYSGYWYPGTAYAGQDHPAGTEGGGGDGGGGESIRESAELSDEDILQDFVNFCVKELKIEQMPRVKLRKDPQWSATHRTFGRYNDENKTLEVAWGQRHIMDVLRTVAHELTHKHQHEREGSRMGPDAGETGSPYENEANARAGVLMRDYGRLHPEYFTVGQAHDLEESASGYIPTKAQAKDPRFSMALTVDIKPGQVGKEANKLKLKTNKQGQPQIAKANGLFEKLSLELAQFKKDLADEDYSPDNPPGPESKPTMPKGTVRVDVSDVYDWYKLGQHISNMKGLGQHDFGAGPPSSIISFGDEDTEHKFIKDLEATGLDVTDIDPVDTKQPPGRKIKTDPTYNVDETIDAPVAKGKDAEQYYKFILGKAKLGRPLTRQEQDYVKMYQMYRQQKLAEFAPSPERDDNDDVPDQLLVLANRWWNATDKQPQIEHVLNSLGWSIHQVESEDDAVQLQHRDGTTHFISANDFDPDLFESAEQLDEVKMSPSALQKWANSPEAQGVRAGFEAELIFRDTNSGDDDNYDMEPDYDMDERCRSINQVVEFFQADDYGYGLSERQAARLQEGLDEQYMEWLDEQMFSSWRDERDELIKEAWLREKPMGERVHAFLVDGMDLSDEEADRIQAVGDQAPKFNSSKEQQAYAEENPDYATYLEAAEGAEEILQEDVEQTIEKEDGFYDEVLDDFRSDFYMDDDTGFFDDVNLRYMSDVAESYDLGWPYMMGSGSNGGSRDWESIGDSLHDAIDMPVKVSSNYHSTPRKEGMWIVEPDSSLSADDQEDFGLEIVSPPMPLEQALQKLQEVTDWANNPSEGNAYTNESTGLHMGVSVPFKGGDVDYLKLILFLGDEYVLKSFGREANTYTKSAMSKFKENIKGGRADPAGAMKLMQSNLIEFAYREIQKGVGEGKYTSAHIQKGYIEFRSAGGDWLAEGDAEPGKLENTMLRYAYAMSLAADPSAERREYAKKLYKLIAPEGDDQLALFSQFTAGELDAEQLKKRWAEKTIGTEKKMNQRWKLYQNVDGRWEPVPGAEWNGYPESEVKNAVWSKYGREALDSGEYQLVNMGEQDWEVYDVNTDKTLEIVKGKSKGEVADAVYDKYVDQGIGFQVRPYVDPATLTPRAKLAQRITTKKPEPRQVANQATNERGVPYWEIYSIKDDWNVIHTFLSDTAADAKVDGANWLTSTGVKYPDRFAVRAKIKKTQVKDIAPDVAQNFAQPATQDATDVPRNWEFVNRINGQVIHNMTNASYNQANVVQDNLETRYPDADIYLRSVSNLEENFVNESIDPVSGAGAVPPRQDPRSIGKKTVTPVEKAFNNPVKGQPYRSAIGQAISQKDLENMTQQIQVARNLGDSINEMEDTPPEVLRALDQAAQKNGYRNWVDVKANPRSPQAVMTVAKLASAILRTTGPHHDKLFYKNKTDVDENFADGKVKGKSRPGRVKRAGASCNGSVTDLRARAKNTSGEKAKMYHWCANMKSGRKK